MTECCECDHESASAHDERGERGHAGVDESEHADVHAHARACDRGCGCAHDERAHVHEDDEENEQRVGVQRRVV